MALKIFLCCKHRFLLFFLVRAFANPKVYLTEYIWWVWYDDSEMRIIHYTFRLHSLCRAFLIFTWSQMSSNMTSSSSRSSWLKFVISVAIKRPVWLEHSNKRGVTLMFSSWSLLMRTRNSSTSQILENVQMQRLENVPLPFAAGILGLSTKIYPEVRRFLAFCNNMFLSLGDDVGQHFSHLSLISTAALHESHR